MKFVIAAAAGEPRANTLVLFKKDLQSRNTVHAERVEAWEIFF
jgi:hypothetical protein